MCCHVGGDHLRPETVDALTHWAGDDEVRFQYVGDSHLDYGMALLEAWEWDDDLAIVEPDIVIRRDVAVGFHECQHDYCCYPYPILTDVMPALGCTRFRKRFRECWPTAMVEALECPGGYGPGHFRSVDVALQRYVLARGHGVQPHVHVPPVEHLNESRALMEGADPTPRMEVPLW